MKKSKIVTNEISKKVFSKWIFGFMGVLWILSTILAFKAVKQPLRIEKKSISNRISQITKYDYKVDVMPSTLFPQGGVVKTNETMFTRIVNSLKLHVESLVKADKPIDIQGSSKLTLKLIAEGLWERDFPLGQEKKINIQGQENKIIQEDITVDIKGLAAYIQRVEKETETRPDKYLLKITPGIQGEAIFESSKIPLDSTQELIFEFSSYIIKPSGEKEFSREVPVESIIIIENDFDLFGTTVPLKLAKYIFPILSILMSILLILGILKNQKDNKDSVKESEIIDKKYKNRLTFIDKRLNPVNKTYINLKNFKSLIQISDEKDIPVLRYENEDIDRVFYYAIDGDYIYSYTAENESENSSLLEVSSSVSENSISQNK